MSYDIYLKDPKTGDMLEFDKPHMAAGGTCQLGGSTEAWLNVTYNYGQHYRRVMGDNGIRGIYGKTGAESIPVFDAAIEQLGDDIDPDYWKSTEGNAKRPLLQLRQMAEAFPEGVWDGD